MIADCYAKMGKEDGHFTYHQETNINGALSMDIVY